MKKKAVLLGVLVLLLAAGLVLSLAGCGTFAGEVVWAVLEGLTGVEAPSSSSPATKTCSTCDGYGVVWETNWQGEGWWINCPRCGGSGQI